MKIVLCGSAINSKRIVEIQKKLSELSIDAEIPKNFDEYAAGKKKVQNETAEIKIRDNLIRDHFEKIRQADAILVVNETKDDIRNKIGGNSFLEIGFAYALNKKIFLLNSIPKMDYTDEIIAMQPIVLDGDLSKIK